MGLNETDLDGDFDPAKFDAAMSRVFGEEYYEGGEDDDFKPEGVEHEAAMEGVEGEGEGEGEGGYEDDVYDHDGEEGWGTVDKDAVSKKSDEAKKLMEEMATMGYDDVEQGTRFKYVQVEKDDFGLTTDEVRSWFLIC